MNGGRVGVEGEEEGGGVEGPEGEEIEKEGRGKVNGRKEGRKRKARKRRKGGRSLT